MTHPDERATSTSPNMIETPHITVVCVGWPSGGGHPDRSDPDQLAVNARPPGAGTRGTTAATAMRRIAHPTHRTTDPPATPRGRGPRTPDPQAPTPIARRGRPDPGTPPAGRR